ncbi:hypothetical protein [Chitiniphilus shinanonensis]|uniref:hypothetical protein n=1 Tax=Chitiniphilus shinanonensis TaxID=553088 RepID=UPI003025CFDC
MGSVIAVKLFAGPAVIAAASLAGKRWGAAVAGMVGGLPLIAGCVIAVLWLEHGVAYAQQAAHAAPAGLWANAAYMLTLAYASRRLGWRGTLLCGWMVYLAVALALAQSGLATSTWVGAASLFGLLLALRLLPRPAAMPRLQPLPRAELGARMLAALLVVAVLSSASLALGPTLTGVLAGGPVAATVLPAFTLAGSGRDALLLQLRGFLTGLLGFGVCFLVLAPLMSRWGVAAVPPAVAATLACGALIHAVSRRAAR